MLFTPRLFEFKTESMTFSAETSVQVASMYADIAYCAALNYWTLTDHDVDSFDLKRIDFHEWATIDTKSYGKMMSVAIEALTGKSIAELNNSKAQTTEENVKKKNFLSIIRRLRRS